MSKTFVEFVSECKAAVVSPTKETFDIKKSETRGELNRTLAKQMDHREFNAPQDALQSIRRVLETYGIPLNKVPLTPNNGGESITAISQFGVSSEVQLYLYFQYTISKSGTYGCFAVVTDESGLNTLLDN